MKKVIIILAFLLSFLNIVNASEIKTVSKEYKILTPDNFTMTATLEYPKIKSKTDFSTIVLLHSLGYNSEWWQTLPKEFLNSGYAVLYIDLRGHGKSIYNSKLAKTSWKSLTNRAFAKYPDDVCTVINYVKKENKRTFFNNWAIVGADIGAGTGIIAANKLNFKPKTIVLLSPIVNSKGLYVPVSLAELNDVDILSIVGTDDISSNSANQYLKKFAQSTYMEYTSESKSTGMLLIKNDPELTPIIFKWINEYLK